MRQVRPAGTTAQSPGNRGEERQEGDGGAREEHGAEAGGHEVPVQEGGLAHEEGTRAAEGEDETQVGEAHLDLLPLQQGVRDGFPAVA